MRQLIILTLAVTLLQGAFAACPVTDFTFVAGHDTRNFNLPPAVAFRNTGSSTTADMLVAQQSETESKVTTELFYFDL